MVEPGCKISSGSVEFEFEGEEADFVNANNDDTWAEDGPPCRYSGSCPLSACDKGVVGREFESADGPSNGSEEAPTLPFELELELFKPPLFARMPIGWSELEEDESERPPPPMTPTLG